ncbi:hypothetical protein LDO26_04935 [Luteimonas sp. BDR2-5]|uniref:hypothetical protein n=1 Tax=Proluteimonas luteida TaxID=2878685 RepID=UPI001E634EB9|nr:hypothetical protein [Luteimonas sp. BDR2-5]MCD9027556.1 hypothetical protein [Luteimonas sp. BDR2-5]
MQDDTIQIRQGAASSLGTNRFGFIGSDGEGGALLDVWDARDDVWLTHHRLRPGAIFPAAGQFLRVLEIRHGEPGGFISLGPAGDAGGIAAVPFEQPVLPLHGSLEVGLSRLELTEPPTTQSARARRWPKLRPLNRTTPDQIEELDLRIGDTLTFGDKMLRVERIQTDAGDIAGFVVFALAP